MIKNIIVGEQMDNFKKGLAVGTSLFNRAKQFTGEKLGGAEKTTYDVNLEALLRRSDATKQLTENIVSNTTSVLHPNPSNSYLLIDQSVWKLIDLKLTCRRAT